VLFVVFHPLRCPLEMRRILVAALLLALAGAAHAEACAEPAVVDEAKLASVCPATKGNCQSLVLHNVCIVQETFIVFAPEDADAHPDGASVTEAAKAFDVTDVAAWFRHASPQQMEDLAHLPHHPHEHGSAVLGHQIAHNPLQLRYAASHEVDAAPVFDTCVTPVVTWSTWVFNLAETFLRLPTNVLRLNQTGAVSHPWFVPVTPLKLPLEGFHEWMLTPFSKNTSRLVSLFEFSDVRHSHEGSADDVEREACFSTVVLLKLTGGGYPDLPKAGDVIAKHYAPSLPEQSLWKSKGTNGTTRIVIETRPNKSQRQFRNLTAVLAACEADSRFECMPRTFGTPPGGVLTDMALMRDADVLVSYHGAGEMNSLWMRHGAALLEVRGAGFGSTHGWWPAFWWPMIGMQTDHIRQFWALNVEDPSRNEDSELQTMGLEKNPGFNARDRCVVLHWEDMLLPMLDKIVPFTNDSPEQAVTRYRALYGPHGTGVVWQLNATGTPLELQPPVFCDGDCKNTSVTCKPC
jgi:hypothetical protein